METAVKGQLGVNVLAHYWKSALDPSAPKVPWDIQNTLLSALRLNILEINRYLHAQRPTLEEFEAWIVECNGGEINETALKRLRRALDGDMVRSEVVIGDEEGLSTEDLAHWDEHGYVVLRNAVNTEAAEAAELAIYEYLGMSREDSESRYSSSLGASIWVSLLRHPAMEANRRSPRIVKAFEQLWGREDLWMNVDQGGLNPPEHENWKFPGPHLHWDISLSELHYFDVLGILYLVDVAEDQGAFSCVPGFHRTLKEWLTNVPPGVDVRSYARETLTMKPIAGKRGDLVIW